MKEQAFSAAIGAIIGGLIVAMAMHYFIQKPQLEKEKAYWISDKVARTLSETIRNTQDGSEYVKVFVANELNSNIYELMLYYDKTNDCEIGQKIKSFLYTLIDMTDDSAKKSKWREKIVIIEQNCK